MNERKKLSDILGGGSGDDFRRRWDGTVAAGDFGPLPPGEYICRTVSGQLFQSKGGTPGYKLTLEVVAGDYRGRRVWCDWWLTPAALPMAKRDLAKLGIQEPGQLERPLPGVFRLKTRLALRKDDDGSERNRLVRFEVLGIEPPDPFAPAANSEGAQP